MQSIKSSPANANPPSAGKSKAKPKQNTPTQFRPSSHNFILIDSKPRNSEDRRRKSKIEGVVILVDGDLAARLLLGLGDDNREDTILHGSMNSILVDTNREGERSRELANATLRNPELGLGLLWLLGFLLGDFGRGLLGGGGLLVFDVGLVVLVVSVLAGFGDGARRGGTFDKASGRGAGLVRAFGATLDGDGVIVAELDLDILLLDTGKFAVQLIVFLDLLDIELGVEGLHLAAVTTTTTSVALRVLIEVLEELEEWVERGVGSGETGKVVERHVAILCLRNWSK